jgi:hypothetical protein
MIPLAKPKRCMISGDWHARAKPCSRLAVARRKTILLEALKVKSRTNSEMRMLYKPIRLDRKAVILCLSGIEGRACGGSF